MLSVSKKIWGGIDCFFRCFLIELFLKLCQSSFFWNRRCDWFFNQISPYFPSVSTVSILIFVRDIAAPSLSFWCFFEGTDPWYLSNLSTFGCYRSVASSSLIFWTSYISFSFMSLSNLKLTTPSLPCWLFDQFKLLIMLPKIKALLEGGQQVYTENATSQGLIFIQRQNVYRTR